MSEFVNTVDVVGDEALTNSIIDKSITEIADNNITQIGKYAFYFCKAMTTAHFPAVTSIDEKAFYGCTALTTVNFPAATRIGKGAIQNCSNLTTVNFPAATIIDEYAFGGCKAMTTAHFPAATSIKGNAFYGCTVLNTADFPVATSIGSYAFESCSNLIALILRSETMCTLSSKAAFSSTPIKSGTGYIYVPRALVDSYKAASNWSTYANQFRAIEDYNV